MGRQKKNRSAAEVKASLQLARAVLKASTANFKRRARSQLSEEEKEEALRFAEHTCWTLGSVSTTEVRRRLEEEYGKKTTATIVGTLLRANGYEMAGRGRAARWKKT
jgi:transposase